MWALDRIRIKDNALKRKAMSYGRMKKWEAQIQAEAGCWLAAAEAADAAEDGAFGGKTSMAKTCPMVADNEKSLARIREAKAALESEAGPPRRGEGSR